MKTKHFSVPALSGNPSFHGGALHYHYPCHGAVQHGGYVFVGCLGDTAQVAAVSVVGPVFSILSAVATMLGAGSSAIIARCFGAGEIEQGKTCSSLCFWSSFFWAFWSASVCW